MKSQGKGARQTGSKGRKAKRVNGSFFFMVSHIKLFNHLNKSTIKIKMNKSTNNCFCFCFFHKKLDLLGNNSHVLVIM